MSSTVLTKLAIAAGGALLGFKVLDDKIHLRSDIRYARRLSPMKRELDAQFAAETSTTADLFATALAKYADKTAILFEDREVTFRDLEVQSNAVANWALSVGLKRGDVAALVMENRPEYIVTWLGLTKIGVQIALINYNLVGRSLLHCISVADSKLVIFGVEVADNLATVSDDLEAKGVPMFCSGGDAAFASSLDDALAGVPSTPVSPALRKGIKFGDNFGYIYTSGTTGLPKAAVIKHAKMYSFGGLFCRSFCVDHTDRVYCTLPLYHSAGGGCGVGMMLYGGATLIIRRKFSASQFWEDCKKYNATVVQYIGELCRYLLTAPPSAADKAHNVRIAIGNGLRPDIWAKFQERFNVPEIGEFYGATEGNLALVNHCVDKESQGAVGRMGALMLKVTGVKLAKFNIEEEIPIRGADGFCIECKDGEAGELLGPVKEEDPRTRFEGYTDPAATSKKVIKDAFVKGDTYFRTGDLLMRDSRGFYHFVDRIGDTFRWKGENVSTTEVAECLSTYPGVLEANVYGAAVPGKDGRACMAAMVVDRSAFDLAGFAKHTAKNLPTYAVPLFLRYLPQVEVTGTFKHMKVKLRKEGADPTKVTEDPLFWLNPASKTYEELDAPAWGTIVNGQSKL